MRWSLKLVAPFYVMFECIICILSSALYSYIRTEFSTKVDNLNILIPCLKAKSDREYLKLELDLSEHSIKEWRFTVRLHLCI